MEGLLGNFNGNASDDLMSTDPNFNKQVASGKAITLLQQYQMMQYRCKLLSNHDRRQHYEKVIEVYSS